MDTLVNREQNYDGDPENFEYQEGGFDSLVPDNSVEMSDEYEIGGEWCC